MSLTHHQRIASFQLSYMLAMIDNLKSREVPKSATWNRLDGLEDKANRALDYYRIHRMSCADLDRAAKLFDRLDTEIKSLYPTTKEKKRQRRQARHSHVIAKPVRRAHL